MLSIPPRPQTETETLPLPSRHTGSLVPRVGHFGVASTVVGLHPWRSTPLFLETGRCQQQKFRCSQPDPGLPLPCFSDIFPKEEQRMRSSKKGVLACFLPNFSISAEVNLPCWEVCRNISLKGMGSTGQRALCLWIKCLPWHVIEWGM